MGPSASGKDTIAKAINREMFGHDGHHLSFSLAGATNHALTGIIEGNNRELPRLATAMEDVRANGLITFNEVKDLPSQQFDKLKVFIEEGVMRPSGKDNRIRPLGLNILFLMGQWGEELFEGKTDEQIKDIVANLTEKDLVKILAKGADNGRYGAVPNAVIQRVVRSGGLYILPPVPKDRYVDVVRLNLEDIVKDLKIKGQLNVDVDESVIQFVANYAAQHSKDLRGLDKVLKRLTETAISEASDQLLPVRGIDIKIVLDKSTLIVTHKKGDIIVKDYRFPVRSLLGSNCSVALDDI